MSDNDDNEMMAKRPNPVSQRPQVWKRAANKQLSFPKRIHPDLNRPSSILDLKNYSKLWQFRDKFAGIEACHVHTKDYEGLDLTFERVPANFNQSIDSII